MLENRGFLISSSRHQLSLFAHISKITWKLDKEDSIAGTVSDQKNGDLRHFDVPDTQALSQFELVNKLWQVL
jgi:kinetochore protein Spc24